MAAAVSGAVCDVGERVARTQSRDVGREGVQAEGNVLAHSWTHVDALTRGIVHPGVHRSPQNVLGWTGS